MKEDKTRKAFIKWAEKQIAFYKPYLDINLQNIEVKHNEWVEYMQMTCVYPYLEPIINFSDRAVKEWVDGDLKRESILHELLHIITDPFYSKANARYVSEKEIEDERERLTDKITVILNNLIK